MGSKDKATKENGMDTELMNLVKQKKDSQDQVRLHTRGGAEAGVLEIGEGADMAVFHLKPLKELYGTGINRTELDPKDEVYVGLLRGIEMEILNIDVAARGKLTDGAVRMALSKLAMSPETEISLKEGKADVAAAVALRIQVTLRLTLSLYDYSRQDVKQAMRRIMKSVELHSKSEGLRGYLEFIRKYVR